MSNHWYLTCRTCDLHSSSGRNHGGEELANMLEILPMLMGVLRHPKCPEGLAISMTYGGYDDFVAFAYQHCGHDLGVVSEYGYIWLESLAASAEIGGSG